MTRAADSSARRAALAAALTVTALLLVVVCVVLSSHDEAPSLPGDVSPVAVEPGARTRAADTLPDRSSASDIAALDVDASERPIVPPLLTGAEGPTRPLRVAVVDASERVVRGAVVEAWTREIDHPVAAELDAARDAYDADSTLGSRAAEAWSRLRRGDPCWGEPSCRATTGADGRAVLQVPEGTIAIAARRGDGERSLRWAGPAWEIFRLPAPDVVEPEGGGELVLGLRPTHQVRGVVLDEHEHLLPDALVVVHMGFGSPRELTGRIPRPVRTDALGRFTLPADEDSMLLVRALHAGRWSAECLVSAHSLRPPQVKVVFPGTLVLKGRIACRGDGPAPTGTVRLFASGSPGTSAPVTQDGRFELAVPCSDTYDLYATLDAHVAIDKLTVVVAAGTTPDEVVLQAIPTTSLAGRVEWTDGSPAAGCEVTTTSAPRAREGAEASWMSAIRLANPRVRLTTGADGSFRMPQVVPGYAYSLQATSPDGGSTTRLPDVVAGTLDALLVLEPSPGSPGRRLHLRVVDGASGEPVPSFVATWSTSESLLDMLHLSTRRSVTDPEGRMQLDDLPPGDAWVAVQVAGRPRAVVGPLRPTDGDEETVVTIGRMSVLEVRVDGRGRAVVPGALVTAVRSDGRSTGASSLAGRYAATSDDGGVARLAQIPPGRYRVQAYAGGTLSDLETVHLTDGSFEWLELTLRSGRLAGFALVSLRDATGAPVPNHDVWLSEHDDSWMSSAVSAGRTDADGRVLLGPVSPGTYAVRSGLDAGKPPTVGIDANRTTEFTLDL